MSGQRKLFLGEKGLIPHSILLGYATPFDLPNERKTMNVGDVVLVTEKHLDHDPKLVGVIGVVQELEGSPDDWNMEKPIRVNFKIQQHFTNCVVPADSLEKVGRIERLRPWFKDVWSAPVAKSSRRSDYEDHLMGLHMP